MIFINLYMTHLTYIHITLPAHWCSHFSNSPQGAAHSVSFGSTWHSTSFTWPQSHLFWTFSLHFSVHFSEQRFVHWWPHGSSFRHGPLHAKSAGSLWHGTCWMWGQFGISLSIRTVQGPHSWKHILLHMWPKSHKDFEHFCRHWYSMCWGSVGWQTIWHVWPHSSLVLQGSMHPPSGALRKSSELDAWITFLGWFWQVRVKAGPT